MKRIPSSEITPESVYLSRRRFIGTAGALAGNALLPSGLWAADAYDELRKELTPLEGNHWITTISTSSRPRKKMLRHCRKDFEPHLGALRLAGTSANPERLISTISARGFRKKSASIDCAAWKAGQW